MKKEVYISKTPKIYKNNKLNQANFGNFNHNDYQIFLYLITKIGGVDAKGKYLQPNQLQREHILTAKELSKEFNIDIKNSYRILKKSTDKLMKTDIRVQELDSDSIARINVCSKAIYNKQEGKISIKFTDDIMPYLAQVRQRFVLYNLKEVTNFKSLYTTRFYELMQEFKHTGWMVKTIPELRKSFAIEETQFKLYADLKRFTFGRAVDEINSIYKINVKFEEIKEGRKVVAIKFIFENAKFIEIKDPVTGIVTKQYAKLKTDPKLIISEKKARKTKTIQNKTESSDKRKSNKAKTSTFNNTKSIKSIVSNVLSKFSIFK